MFTLEIASQLSILDYGTLSHIKYAVVNLQFPLAGEYYVVFLVSL